eukprot:COSAG03_NODE_87_length_13511_cov_37.669326_4_plen_189_part_00
MPDPEDSCLATEVSLLHPRESSAPATQRGEGPEARVLQRTHCTSPAVSPGQLSLVAGVPGPHSERLGHGCCCCQRQQRNQSRDVGGRGVRGAVCASRAVRRRQGYRVERGARSAWQQQPSRRWRRRGRARAPHRCKQNALLLEPAGARDPGRQRRCCAGAADAQNRRRGTSACVPHCLFSPAILSHKH